MRANKEGSWHRFAALLPSNRSMPMSNSKWLLPRYKWRPDRTGIADCEEAARMVLPRPARSTRPGRVSEPGRGEYHDLSQNKVGRSGCWRGLFDDREQGLRPEPVALFPGMDEVGHQVADDPALGIKEMLADVQIHQSLFGGIGFDPTI